MLLLLASMRELILMADHLTRVTNELTLRIAW